MLRGQVLCRSRSRRWGAVLMLASAMGACAAPAEYRTQPLNTSIKFGHRPPDPEPVSIVSAHISQRAAPAFADLDTIAVVFSTDIDPTTLVPNAFMLVRVDGSRLLPSQAVLTPASEGDENRTVVLAAALDLDPEADVEPVQDATLADVMVIGRVYTEDGRSLRGLSAPVVPFDHAGTVAAAERLRTHPRMCEGSPQAVRTFWIDSLRDVAQDDLDRVKVVLSDGSEVSPIAFDDHDLEGDERGEDNVLDLCVGTETPVRRLRIDAEAFSDPSGHRTAAVDVAVADWPDPKVD